MKELKNCKINRSINFYFILFNTRTCPGGKETPVTSAPRVTTKPTQTQPVQTVSKSQCTNRIGAALYGRDGKTYIFNGKSFYILYKSDISMGVEHGPLVISAKFIGITHVDAVFRRPPQGNKNYGMIVFFHDDT